jgi:hypothetical protein
MHTMHTPNNLPGSCLMIRKNLRIAQPTSRDGACAVAGHFFQIPNDSHD